MLEGHTTLAQFIIEQAGGWASTWRDRVLKIEHMPCTSGYRCCSVRAPRLSGWSATIRTILPVATRRFWSRRCSLFRSQ